MFNAIYLLIYHVTDKIMINTAYILATALILFTEYGHLNGLRFRVTSTDMVVLFHKHWICGGIWEF